MEDKICIKSLLPEQLADLMKQLCQPSYRAKQVFRLLQQGVGSFDEMSDLPKALREALKETCRLTRPEILRKQVSAHDGTIKYLFGLEDGNSIETVLMQYEHGNSICVSTQAGCKMGSAPPSTRRKAGTCARRRSWMRSSGPRRTAAAGSPISSSWGRGSRWTIMKMS